ncbi:hypothetical protein PVMG_05764 [Plasmodium vivax Mauritania I]|uniref:Pv-fam-c protein n=1 Tax=Plasmodium vivax Mauritania I TaxID=1035515 RepID=A0A0J9W3V1_PLAVI|nr:hypothetical protein PVMG_05764 [Plasmodium vivax Mauritania I]
MTIISNTYEYIKKYRSVIMHFVKFYLKIGNTIYELYTYKHNRRNINIINGVKFGKILGYIQKKNKDGIDSWINKYESTLTDYLNKKQKSWKNIDRGKYCTNLNYIIDFIVQAIHNLNVFERIKWNHKVQTISKNTLLKYPLSDCTRNLDNYENNNLFFKKLILDLCEDIEYFNTNKMFPKNKNKCLKIISRLKYREKVLKDFFYTFRDKSIFYLNDKCSIDFIHKNLNNVSCNQAGEKPKTIVASEEARDTASSSDDRADQHRGEGATETEALKAAGPDDGLDNSEQVDPIPEDLTFSLPVNDDPPKLDTTYAAASLAGVSLFGTILYKVKYHRIIEILCASFIFYVI